MGHLTSRDAYRNLEDRINWFTQGAPASETLTKILQVLFTEKEAKWVAKLPIEDFLRPQGRFKHLFKPGNEHLLALFQEEVDRRWEDLQYLCAR